MKNKGRLLKGSITTVLVLVLMLALGLTAFATAETGSTIYVNTSDVNVRDSAGTNGNKVAVLQTDTALTVLGSQNDSDGKLWYNVSFTYQGIEKSGWIRYDFTTTAVPEGMEVPDDAEVEPEAPADGEMDAGNDQMMDFTLGQIGTITPTEGDGEPDNLPEDFRSVYVRGNGEEVPAWTDDKYYIFYAVTSNGNEGWYLYDSEERSYVRYGGFMTNISSAPSQADATVSANGSGTSKAVVVILSVVVVLLVAVTAVMGMKLLNRGGDSYEDNDDEDEDEDGAAEQPRRKALFNRRSARDDDDEDDDDEDDDDDDDDDEEDYPRRRPSSGRPGQVRGGSQAGRSAGPVRGSGQPVRSAGGQAARPAGQVVRNANGQLVRTSGGQAARPAGQVVRNANGQLVRTGTPVVRNANGQVVRTQKRVQRPIYDEDDE